MTTKHGVTIFASAALDEGANNSDDVNSNGARGVYLVLDVSAVSGTDPTLDVKLQRKDAVSGAYVDLPLAVFAQQTGIATVELVVYPGIAVVANVSVNNVLSEEFRAVATVGGTDTPTVTFSLAGSLIG